MWWKKFGTRPNAKACYGDVSSYGHRRLGEIRLCQRHVCSDQHHGCRLIAREQGYKCATCSRTDEGKERIKDHDQERRHRRGGARRQ
jgi:hypothetical protein